jgi:hypothetical protein
MRGTGEMIKQMGMACIHMLMGRSTKDTGKTTSNMVRGARTGPTEHAT